MHLEHEILNDEITLPVYFVLESPALRSVFSEIKQMASSDIESSSAAGKSRTRDSTFPAMLNVIWSTGHRLSVQATTPKVAPSVSITNIEVYLLYSQRLTPRVSFEIIYFRNHLQ